MPRLHPDLQRRLDEAAGAPPITAVSVEVARNGFAARQAALPLVPVATVEDRVIVASGRNVRLRIYSPDVSNESPGLIFFHGGGFVIGSIGTHDAFCRLVCRDSNIKVISVDYALAPEHKFPAAIEDCLAAIRWVSENAGDVGANTAQLILAGDSAGANLALACALRLRGELAFAGLALAYPVTGAPDPTRRSYAEYASGYGLTADAMKWFFDHYLSDPTDASHPDVSVSTSEKLGTLPPTWLLTAEFDPLRDEGLELADRLATLGVQVAHVHHQDANHGFMTLAGASEPSGKATRQLCGWLADAIAASGRRVRHGRVSAGLRT